MESCCLVQLRLVLRRGKAFPLLLLIKKISVTKFLGLPHANRQPAVSTQWLEDSHFIWAQNPRASNYNWGSSDSPILGSVNLLERLTELRDTVIAKERVGGKGAQSFHAL